MTKPMFNWILAMALVVIADAGCKKGEQPNEGGVLADDEEGESQDVETAKALWLESKGYRDWTAHSDMPVPGQEPHGAYIHLFYNDTTDAAIGGDGAWPDGAILVKDNYSAAGDGPGELMAVTIMKKMNGTWFWAKYEPDGALAETPEGMPIAGTENLGCIDCHASAELRDHVITELHADD